MRKTVLGIALAAPLAALAAPPGPPGRGPGGPPDEPGARQEQMMKRMRMARTLGLAEALDLGEAEALRLREVLSKFDERREAVARQMREAMDSVKKAARGDAAAQKGIDDALKRMRELRTQAHAIDEEMLQAVSKDLSPERKAKAALFFHHFKKRMNAHLMQLREQSRGMRGRMGPGDGGGPPGRGPRWGMGPGGGMGGDEADLEILPDSGPM